MSLLGSNLSCNWAGRVETVNHWRLVGERSHSLHKISLWVSGLIEREHMGLQIYAEKGSQGNVMILLLPPNQEEVFLMEPWLAPQMELTLSYSCSLPSAPSCFILIPLLLWPQITDSSPGTLRCVILEFPVMPHSLPHRLVTHCQNCSRDARIPIHLSTPHLTFWWFTAQNWVCGILIFLLKTENIHKNWNFMRSEEEEGGQQ